jgi:hypothetical protein
MNFTLEIHTGDGETNPLHRVIRLLHEVAKQVENHPGGDGRDFQGNTCKWRTLSEPAAKDSDLQQVIKWLERLKDESPQNAVSWIETACNTLNINLTPVASVPAVIPLPPLADRDQRPQQSGWAPGFYGNQCVICGSAFIGDKRAVACAPCAYAAPSEPRDERAEFEKWHKATHGTHLDRNKDDDYVGHVAQARWQAWKARSGGAS